MAANRFTKLAAPLAPAEMPAAIEMNVVKMSRTRELANFGGGGRGRANERLEKALRRFPGAGADLCAAEPAMTRDAAACGGRLLAHDPLGGTARGRLRQRAARQRVDVEAQGLAA